MSIGALIGREIKRYGQRVLICKDGGETEICAIVTPLRYKNKMYLEGDVSSLGYVDQSHYLYIGSVEQDLTLFKGNFILRTQDGDCIVKKSEKVYFKGKPLYIWAVLQKCGGEGQEC